ncbi:MAG: tetratricopeptide repeat protein [Candidatus Delongbacteria bacterium]|nr:tetratricopeptide repeat protein [Candidatus Delongbacteria bacterium]
MIRFRDLVWLPPIHLGLILAFSLAGIGAMTPAFPALVVIGSGLMILSLSNSLPGTNGIDRFDVLLTGLALWSMINLHYSLYWSNTILFVHLLFYLIFLVILIRIRPIPSGLRGLLAAIVAAGGAIPVLLVIAMTLLVYLSVRINGFDNVLDFRYMITPFGMPLNEWATPCLLLFPFPLLALIHYHHLKPVRIGLVIISLVISLSLMFSFSRGIYLALAVMLLFDGLMLMAFRLISLRKLILWAMLYGSVILIVILPLHDAFLTTIRLNRTLSQRRSLESRPRIWLNSLKLFRRYPLTGIGAYNFCMAYVTVKDNSDDARFTSRASNLPILILIEGGIIGIVMTIALISFLLIKLKSSLLDPSNSDTNKIERILLAGAMIGLLVRELSFTSWLDNRLTLILSALIVGLILNPCEPVACTGARIRAHIGHRIGWMIPIILIPLAIYCGYHSFRLELAKQCHQKAIRYRATGDLPAAWRWLEKAIGWNPRQALFYSDLALIRYGMVDPGVPFDKSRIDSLGGDRKADAGLHSIGDLYQTALVLNPEDDACHHNLAWIYRLMGDPERAEYHFKQAILIDPLVSIYPISLGMLYEKSGRAQDAVEAYSRAVRLSPDILDSPFFQELDDAYRQAIDSLVEIMIAELVVDQGDPIRLGRAAKLYYHFQCYDDAESLLTKITGLMPNLNRPWHWLGKIHHRRNRWGPMRDCWLRSIFINPWDYLSAMELGHYYAGIGNEHDAEYYFQVAGFRYERLFSEVYLRRRYTYYLPVAANDLIPQGLLHYINPAFIHNDTIHTSE